MGEFKGTQYKAWFTSDLHFSHASTLYFHPERREVAGITLEELQADKFKAIEKFDEWLINKWNTTIKKRDFVYILGDFCLGNKERTKNILNKLHGRKFLIIGNHDKSCQGLDNYFEWVGEIKEVKFTHNQYPFIDPDETFAVELCHFPMVAWNRRPHGTCHLHGHTHGALDGYNEDSQELRLDVGFDAKLSNLGFIDLETVYNSMKRIITTTDSKTFIEHTEKLMNKQGFRA
jgi:calcineurin-like phosphoesterase family protein